jgi:hypothetical protein
VGLVGEPASLYKTSTPSAEMLETLVVVMVELSRGDWNWCFLMAWIEAQWFTDDFSSRNDTSCEYIDIQAPGVPTFQ